MAERIQIELEDAMPPGAFVENYVSSGTPVKEQRQATDPVYGLQAEPRQVANLKTILAWRASEEREQIARQKFAIEESKLFRTYWISFCVILFSGVMGALLIMATRSV